MTRPAIPARTCKPCAYCSRSFETKRQPFRAEARFCSVDCRIRDTAQARQPKATFNATRARTAKAVANAPESRACLQCQAIFTPKAKKRDQKHCSHPCALKASRFNQGASRFRQWNGVNEPERKA